MFEKLKAWYQKRVELNALVKADKLYEDKRKAITATCTSCIHEWDTHEFKRVCKKCSRYEIMTYSKFGNIRYSWVSIDPIELP